MPNSLRKFGQKFNEKIKMDPCKKSRNQWIASSMKRRRKKRNERGNRKKRCVFFDFFFFFDKLKYRSSLIGQVTWSFLPHWLHHTSISFLILPSLYIGPNHWTISSSHCCKGPPGVFFFFGLFDITQQLLRSTCLWILQCVQSNGTSAFDTLWSHPSFHSLPCPVSWGCRIHRLLLCRRIRPPPPMSVLDMTLNNLIVRLQ